MVEVKKYVGRIVRMIYMDKEGRITKRRIYVHSIRGTRLIAFCQEAKALRTFSIDNILAMEPVTIPELRGVGVV